VKTARNVVLKRITSGWLQLKPKKINCVIYKLKLQNL